MPIARDALIAEAGLDLAIGPHATVDVSYFGQIAGKAQDHAAKGRLSWKFQPHHPQGGKRTERHRSGAMRIGTPGERRQDGAAARAVMAGR